MPAGAGRWAGRRAGRAAVLQPEARCPCGGGTACKQEAVGRAIRAPRGLGEAW